MCSYLTHRLFGPREMNTLMQIFRHGLISILTQKEGGGCFVVSQARQNNIKSFIFFPFRIVLPKCACLVLFKGILNTKMLSEVYSKSFLFISESFCLLLRPLFPLILKSIVSPPSEQQFCAKYDSQKLKSYLLMSLRLEFGSCYQHRKQIVKISSNNMKQGKQSRIR